MHVFPLLMTITIPVYVTAANYFRTGKYQRIFGNYWVITSVILHQRGCAIRTTIKSKNSINGIDNNDATCIVPKTTVKISRPQSQRSFKLGRKEKVSASLNTIFLDQAWGSQSHLTWSNRNSFFFHFIDCS